MSNLVENKDKKEVTTTSAEQLVDSKNSFKPDVNIYYTEDELILVTDLPGVKKGDVNIEIDENNTLILKAKSSFTEPEGLVYKQFNSGNYYRAFTISNEYDKENVNATLENGVLELRIAKREEVKPKTIKISA